MAVVLYAITHVGLYVALIIHPGNSELVNAIGDAKTLNQISFVKLRMFVVLFFNGSKNFSTA